MRTAIPSTGATPRICWLKRSRPDIRIFDTAEIYGTAGNPHENEEIVGEALKPYRDKVVLATKFGIAFDKSAGVFPYPLVSDSRPEKIVKSVEGSLKRLKTDRIDLYYQHRPDPSVPVEEVAEVMQRLIKEGKILHWGLSEADEENILRAHRVCPLTAIQNRYHMMYRNNESLFPVLERLGIGFVAFSPLANGLLSGRYDRNTVFAEAGDYRSVMPQFRPEAYELNRDFLDLLYRTAKAKNAEPSQISLAWMMCKKQAIVPIPGTRKIDRMLENAKAADVILSADEVARLDEALNKAAFSDVYGGVQSRAVCKK